MMKRFLTASLVILCIAACSGQREYDYPADLEDLYRQRPDMFERLFASLDLERAGLAGARARLEAGDPLSAAREIVAYYKQSRWSIDADKVFLSYIKGLDEERLERARSILQDVFTNQAVTGTQARLASGLIDWKYLGPKTDNEWMAYQSRQYLFRPLLYAYRVTGDEAFARYFDATITDWIYQNPLPPQKVENYRWGPMDVGTRLLSSWPAAFYGFQESESFTPLARIMMLMSIPEQAEYLRKYHYRHHNHAVKEMCGLASAAVFWPEYRRSGEWLDHSITQMTDEVNHDVYPDGVHKELSGHYHNNVRQYFMKFIEIVQRSDRQLPSALETQITRMTDYLAAAMRPSGYGLNNNDADLDYIREILLGDAQDAGREDWLYIASYGEQGRPPAFTSSFYPYAGQLVMRDNWSRRANWGFFDLGPWGTSHQHNDKLHLSLAAYGTDILVDAGRYTYDKVPLRGYFTGSRSHNVVLVDGHEQNRLPAEADRPVPEEDYRITETGDFAMGVYDAGFGPLDATHARAVYFDKEAKYWLVVDHIDIDRPRTVTTLWHFHPDVVVTERRGTLLAQAGESGLLMCPLGLQGAEIRLIKGQMEPYIQGWWSREYNHKVPSTAAEIDMALEGSGTVAWQMIPFTGRIPECSARLTGQQDGSLVVTVGDGDDRKTVAVDFVNLPHLQVSRVPDEQGGGGAAERAPPGGAS